MTIAALLGSIPSPGSSSINIGPLELRAYGLAIAVGVIVAVTMAQRRRAAWLGRVNIWTSLIAIGAALASLALLRHREQAAPAPAPRASSTTR